MKLNGMENSFQVVTFYTSPNSLKIREEDLVICGPHEKIGTIDSLMYKLFRTSLLIPPTPPTASENTNIIQIQYILQVREIFV